MRLLQATAGAYCKRLRTVGRPLRTTAYCRRLLQTTAGAGLHAPTNCRHLLAAVTAGVYRRLLGAPAANYCRHLGGFGFSGRILFCPHSVWANVDRLFGCTSCGWFGSKVVCTFCKHAVSDAHATSKRKKQTQSANAISKRHQQTQSASAISKRNQQAQSASAISKRNQQTQSANAISKRNQQAQSASATGKTQQAWGALECDDRGGGGLVNHQ
jgi:hypothetical protein